MLVLVAALVADAIWARKTVPGGTREFWMFGSPAAWVVGLMFMFTVTPRADRRALAIILSIVAAAMFVNGLSDPCGGPFALMLLVMLPGMAFVSVPVLVIVLLISGCLILLASLPRRLRLAAIPLWIPWSVVSIAASFLLIAGVSLIGARWQGGPSCAW